MEFCGEVWTSVEQGGIATSFRMNQDTRSVVPRHQLIMQREINQPFGHDAILVSGTAIGEGGFDFGKVGGDT